MSNSPITSTGSNPVHGPGEEAISGSDGGPIPSAVAPTLAVPVAQLIAQYLVGRVDGLPAPQVAAFVSGWTSALELVSQTDLLLPDAPDNVRQAIAVLCAAIERAQQAILADPED